ncbi:hypothetical protein [Dactylosporangium sp. CS-033363]|uniref:hypothetical protein n=1 Tax=Dactylosporangium sp. CS-033363 TaxID=3239935 RepID=UPI003D8C45DE
MKRTIVVGDVLAFGHHVTGREPLLRDGIVFGLDTGACHGWNLTAASFPDGTIYSVPARRDHWATVKVEWQEPVLKTRAWLDLPWDKLSAEASRFAHVPWTSSLVAWSEALQALVPALSQAVAQSPTFRGSPERMCRTPPRVLDIAGTLGVPTPPRPF